MMTQESVSNLLEQKPLSKIHPLDLTYTIELIVAVKEGLAELDRGESFTLEEVEKEIPSWIIR